MSFYIVILSETKLLFGYLSYFYTKQIYCLDICSVFMQNKSIVWIFVLFSFETKLSLFCFVMLPDQKMDMDLLSQDVPLKALHLLLNMDSSGFLRCFLQRNGNDRSFQVE